MNEQIEWLLRGIVIGAGGSAAIDAWSIALRRFAGVSTLDYAMVGRWIGHLRHRRFIHDRIASSDPVRGERLLGWFAHYAIGVAFAFALLSIEGLEWARSPSIGPAMVVGMVTVAAPWFIMQPGMGAGIAAAKTPHPVATRVRNLATHAVYGLGLYATAVVLVVIAP